jgi:hypothetical protein
MASKDWMKGALTLRGQKITRRRRIGPQAVLVVLIGADSVEAQLEITNARGEATSYPIDLDRDAALELERVDVGGFSWEDKPGVEKALRALASIGARPSDYGTDRATLTGFVEAGNVAQILAQIPVGRAIGRAKVRLTPRDLGEAIEALIGSVSGRRLVLSVVAGDGPTRVVCGRVPVDVYSAIAAAAEAAGSTVNQVVVESLSQAFLKR